MYGHDEDKNGLIDKDVPFNTLPEVTMSLYFTGIDHPRGLICGQKK